MSNLTCTLRIKHGIFIYLFSRIHVTVFQVHIQNQEVFILFGYVLLTNILAVL